ncbi:unnamed protein product [Penicillium salamii]|nr:unnamed protein product [Penicillium salamii]CAG8175907.1 unnamed protein product [Penicillium salamii]CAG8368184.1 unnamed protein product [Penicillium salamii]
MQDSEIPSQGEPWGCSLQLSTRAGDIDTPPTKFHSQADGSASSGLQCLQSFDVGFLNRAGNDCLATLIDGYARWIITVSDQKHVAFCATIQRSDAIVESVIVVAQFVTGSNELVWEAHKSAGVGTDKLEFGLCLVKVAEIEHILPESVRVALSVDIQESVATLTHRRVSTEGAEILSKSHLESFLRSSDARSYWQTELREFVGCTERQFPAISCDRLVVAAGSDETLSQSLTFELSLAQLEALTQQNHLTSPLSAIRAAFACILAEYIESDRVILGERALETSVHDGFETLVPIVLLPDDTAQSLLSRVDEFAAKSAQMSKVSTEVAREILEAPSDSPIYNALLIHHVEETSFESSTPSPTETSAATSDAAIKLHLQLLNQADLEITLSVKATLIDSAHLSLALRQISALTTILLTQPTESIQNLSEYFPNDLLAVHTPNVSEQLRNAPLLSPAHWVDHWAASNPDWNAVEIVSDISEDGIQSQTWTYEELSQTSNQICDWIKAHGWQNRSIAVCLGRSFMAYALVLAIWKSGNCYVPVAEDLPEARQIFLLADSGAIAFFADKNVAETIVPPDDCAVIDIDDPSLLKAPAAIESSNPFIPNPTDDCYLLYTSGSTGTPKGVLVSRGNLSAFTEAQSEYICRDVPDTTILKGTGSYLAHASRAFDVHICEMVLGWRHGLRLVTGPRTMLLDNLFVVLSKLRITHAGFVPSLLEHAGVSAELLPDLRYLGVGGEKISETIIERFVGKPSIALVNAYGPTEVTIGMTSHTVKPWSTVRNIGTAVGNITIHVLEDDTMKHVKRGQAGELCVTGDLVANGYHRRPDAGGFVDFHGQRMYRTGDIVRLMANNCVEYLGRRDSQAKIRGQRLELEEVSVAVRRCATFPVNVTSIVTPSPITKRPQLVSFVTPSTKKPDGTPKKPTFLKDEYQEWAPAILARCSAELPAYMVPSVLLTINSIPIQISGKADTRRLVALYESIPVSDLLLKPSAMAAEVSEPDSESSQTPLTKDEELIREIICTQLRVEDHESIKKSTNIFQLGMDSLASLAVAANMRKAGYVCAAADVLSNATVTQLACLPRTNGTSAQGSSTEMLSSQADEASQKLVQIDQSFRTSQNNYACSNISAVWPCLPLQESLVSSSVGNSTPLYVNHIMCRLGAGINISALREAFEDLMHENEILRTCFHVTEDKVLQVVLKPRATKLPWIQLPVSEEANACNLFKSLQAGIASRIVGGIESSPPFHLLAGESTNGEPGWLMLSIHHSIFDGASMDIFLGRLHRHYTGNGALRPTDLTPLYRHFLSDNEAKNSHFWTGYLTGCTPSIIAHDSGDDVYQILVKKLPFSLSALSRFASKNRTTASMILETAWAITLAKNLGQNDVVYGRVMNGRGIPVENIESMLIPLVTTIPARLQLSSGSSKLLDQVKAHTAAIIASIPYQHTPLRAIQRYAGVSGPLFNAMFSYLTIGPQSPADEMLFEMESSMQVDYPLALEVRAESDPDAVTLRLRVADDPSLNEKFSGFVDNVSASVEDLISDGDVVVDAPTVSQRVETRQPTWDETQWAEDETTLRQAVSEITGIPEFDISKKVSFFALGIDSVVSLHLSRRLQGKGLSVSSSDILRYSSIGALKNRLNKLSAKSKPIAVVGRSVASSPSVDLFSKDDSVVETYPCTPLQTAMIGQCLSSEGKGYVHHHSVLLDASIDLQKLVKAWKPVTERVDILRTSFHRQDGSREIHAAVHQSPIVNCAHEEVESFPAAIEKISKQTAYPTIGEFGRPPWHITFLTEGVSRLMVVTMHHCLYDGFSLPVLFDAVEKQYHGIEVSVRPFAPVARNIVSTQGPSANFWVNSVSEYRCPQEPLQSSPTQESTVHWAETTIQTPVAALQRQCGLLNVTLQTVALLAYGRSLALHLGQRDVVFGHVVSGRGFDLDETASVIGPLFNTVPFRLKLDSLSQSVRSTLQNIQNFCIDSQPHHHAPLARIQKEWRLATEGSGSSLFNSIFSFNKSYASDGDSIFEPYRQAENPDVPHYPLNVEFDQTQDALVIRATCHDQLTKAELDDLVLGVARDIEAIVSSGDEPVLSFPTGLSDLPLVPAAHRNPAEKTGDAVDQDVTTLRKIFSDITGISIKDIHGSSGVFALGVDSILALDMSARCRDAKLKVSVTDILQGGTIQGIAALAASKAAASANSQKKTKQETSVVKSESKTHALELLGLAEDEVEDTLPCLSGQLFYLSSWMQSKRKLWEFSFVLSSRTKLDLDRLQTAWTQLQNRHTILRTSFAAISPEEILQVVRKTNDINQVVQVDSGQSTEDLTSIVQGLLNKVADESSNLFTPPVRLHLVQHSESDAILLTLHHALYDARSIPILLNELEELYHGNTLEPTCSFSSFVLDTVQESNSPSSLKFWEDSLKLGQQTLMGTTSENNGDLKVESLGRTFHQGLDEIQAQCHSIDVSVPSLILLSVGRTLAQTAGVAHPTFGLFQSGRSGEYPEIQNMAGPTVNLLPVVVPNALKSSTVAGLLTMQQDLVQRVSHEQTDLGNIRRKMREIGNELQFNVIVNVVWGPLNASGVKENTSIFTPFSAGSLTQPEIEPPTGATSIDKFDWTSLVGENTVYLEVSPDEENNGIRWNMDYKPASITTDQAQMFLDTLGKELDTISEAI